MLMIVAAVCGYEAAALVAGRGPTVTSLSRQSILFRAVVLGGLAYHFRRVAEA